MLLLHLKKVKKEKKYQQFLYNVINVTSLLVFCLQQIHLFSYIFTLINSVLYVNVIRGLCAKVMANPKQENLPTAPVADPKKSKKTKA